MAQKQAEIEIIPPKDIWVGNKKAPVKLVMYGDYESEACAKANEAAKERTKLASKFFIVILILSPKLLYQLT